jgi:hypothetical protein
MSRRHRGGVEVWPYCFFNLGARWGWLFNVTSQPLYPREITDTYSILSWVDPRVVVDDTEKSTPKRVRTLKRPARSGTIYRLRYAAPLLFYLIMLKWAYNMWKNGRRSSTTIGCPVSPEQTTSSGEAKQRW